MRPKRNLALSTLTLSALAAGSGCILDAEIGSDQARISAAPLDIETCVDDCLEPGALLWTDTVPLERPAVFARDGGEIVLVGNAASRTGELDQEPLRLVRLAADGSPIADTELAITGGLTIALTELPGDELAVAVDSLGGHISAITLDGTVRWTHPLGTASTVAIVSDDEGSIYAGASLMDPDQYAEPWLGKLDVDGTLLWSRTALPSVLPAAADAESGEGPYNGVSAVALDADGDLVAVGQGTGPANANLAWIAKFDAETGDELWSDTFEGGHGDLAISGPSHYIISGYRQLVEFEPAAGITWAVDDPQALYKIVGPSELGILGATNTDYLDSEGGSEDSGGSDYTSVVRYHGIDAADGSVLWTRETSSAELSDPWSRIDIDGDRMIAVFGEFAKEGHVMVFRLE